MACDAEITSPPLTTTPLALPTSGVSICTFVLVQQVN
jgi:hypothetical protein